MSTALNNIEIKNLFRVEEFMEACKANYGIVAIKNKLHYKPNINHNLHKFIDPLRNIIIGINDFCCFTNINAPNFISEKIQKGFKIILPEDLDLPLELTPFCITTDTWAVNFIQNYIASGYNNVSAYIKNIGYNPFIYMSKEWSSSQSSSIVMNCINYSIENIFDIIIQQNNKFGIV